MLNEYAVNTTSGFEMTRKIYWLRDKAYCCLQYSSTISDRTDIVLCYPGWYSIKERPPSCNIGPKYHDHRVILRNFVRIPRFLSNVLSI
jgi:hypothetical protein